MEAPQFRKLIEELTNVKEIDVVGCCTDICVLNGTMALSNYLNQFNKAVEIKVHQDAVATFNQENRKEYVDASLDVYYYYIQNKEFFGSCRYRAERTANVLRVSRGEGISRSLLPGGLDDGEIGVAHPRTGDAAGDLQELIDQGSHKANTHQIIALALVHAPERHQCGDEKHRLAAQMGQCGYDGIQPGSPQPLKQIQKIHSNTSSLIRNASIIPEKTEMSIRTVNNL